MDGAAELDAREGDMGGSKDDEEVEVDDDEEDDAKDEDDKDDEDEDSEEFEFDEAEEEEGENRAAVVERAKGTSGEPRSSDARRAE